MHVLVATEGHAIGLVYVSGKYWLIKKIANSKAKLYFTYLSQHTVTALQKKQIRSFYEQSLNSCWGILF